MRPTLLATSCGLSLFSILSLAAEVPVLLDDIVVTATRLPHSILQTHQHSTVIDGKAIRTSGAADVPTLLRQQAGIEITQQGGLGNQSSVFLRGANSSHTLILVDGVRLASATTGATAIDQIMLDEIERIEVVRGNVSSIYGSEAIGGVIQIFTKKGRGTPAPAVSASLGSYGTQKLSAGYGGDWSGTSLHLGLSHRRSDGFSAIRKTYTAETDRDGHSNTTLNLNLSHSLGSDHEVGLTALHSDGNVKFDGAFNNGSEQEIAAYSLFSRNRLTDAWSSRLSLNLGRDRLNSFLNGLPTGRVGTENRQIEWLNEITLDSGQTATVALSQLTQRVSTDLAYTRTQRRLNSLALGYAAGIGAHGIQLNARHDDYSDLGGHTTGLAGYSYTLARNWMLLASLSSAFKAPTFTDLYNPAWGGNPNLRPEKAESREAGLQYDGEGIRGRLVWFGSRITDLIAADNTWTLQNIGRAENDGWEASLSGRLGGFAVRAMLTLQDPVNALTGAPLPRRAKRHGSLTVGKETTAWHMALEAHATAARSDYHVVTFGPVEVPGYTVWNLTGGYALDRQSRLTFRLENLFDRDYALVHGYGTPGRGLYVTFDWQG